MEVKLETQRNKLTERAKLKAQYRVNRVAAAKAGKMHFAGQPCCNGHNGLRYVSTGNCVACVAPQRRNRIFARLKENAKQQKKAELIEKIVELCG